jgi:hypothetical protein
MCVRVCACVCVCVCVCVYVEEGVRAQGGGSVHREHDHYIIHSPHLLVVASCIKSVRVCVFADASVLVLVLVLVLVRACIDIPHTCSQGDAPLLACPALRTQF